MLAGSQQLKGRAGTAMPFPRLAPSSCWPKVVGSGFVGLSAFCFGQDAVSMLLLKYHHRCQIIKSQALLAVFDWTFYSNPPGPRGWGWLVPAAGRCECSGGEVGHVSNRAPAMAVGVLVSDGCFVSEKSAVHTAS